MASSRTCFGTPQDKPHEVYLASGVLKQVQHDGCGDVISPSEPRI